MRQFAKIALASSLLLSTVACAQPVATPVASTPVAAAAATNSKADASRLIVASAIAGATNPAVKDLGHANGAAVAVTVKAPADRKVLALQHRWLAKDIASYEVTLLSADANGDYTTTVATLSIAPAAYNTSTTDFKALAAFTGLEANKKYKVTVEAWGSNTSTTATQPNQQLNTQTAAEALFDFMEDSNATIETSPPAQDVNVVLDSYEFSGSATVNTKVTEGTFKPAAGGVKATAIKPLPKASSGVNWGAWGWDIVGLYAQNIDMTPLLANDGNAYVPNGVIWVALDGDGHSFPGGGYWFNAETMDSLTENWYLGGQFTPHGTRTYGFKAVYNNGAGVYAESEIQATTYIAF